LAAVVSVAACALPTFVLAQSMDYDLLQRLFAEPVTSSAEPAVDRRITASATLRF
jgi:hypothetical protein